MSHTSLTQGGVTTQYTYDANNRLTYEDNGTAAKAYSYDPNGNRILERDIAYENVDPELELTGSANYRSYSYNLGNMLTQSQNNGTATSYAYYADGLRKSKTTGVSTTGYVWNGSNMIAETDGQSITKTHIHGLDGITATAEGSTKTYYIKDAHGSVTTKANADGTIISTPEYDAFGVTNTTASGFGYSGEYTDAETGFVYLRARMYDTKTGAFITEDPARDGLNWYAYCAGNPVALVDPWGLAKEKAVYLSFSNIPKGLDVGNDVPEYITKLTNDKLSYVGGKLILEKVSDEEITLPEGTGLIRGLFDSPFDLHIEINYNAPKNNASHTGSDGAMSDAKVTFNPHLKENDSLVYDYKNDVSFYITRPFFITVAHELKHAYDYMTPGGAPMVEGWYRYKDSNGVWKNQKIYQREAMATGINFTILNEDENGMLVSREVLKYSEEHYTERAISEEHGLFPRTHYFSN